MTPDGPQARLSHEPFIGRSISRNVFRAYQTTTTLAHWCRRGRVATIIYCIGKLVNLMSFKRSVLNSTVMRVVSAALTFLNGLVLARMLGSDFYGQYVLILSWISLGYVVSTAGLPTLVLREVSLSHAEGRGGLSRGMVIFAVVVFLGLLGLCGLTYWLAADVLGFALSTEGEGWIAWATIFFWGLGILLENATRGQGRTSIGQVAELLIRPGGMLVVFLALYAVKETGTVDSRTALIALFVATLGSALFSVIIFLRYLGPLRREPTEFALQSWLLGGIYHSGASILIKGSFPVSFLLIGYLVGSAELGVYRVAYQLSVAAGIGLLAVKVTIAPQIARLLIGKRRQEERDVYLKSIMTSLAFSMPACLILLALPQTILIGVFGPDYAGGALSLQVLATGVLINSAFGPIDTVLEVKRHDKALLYGALLRVVLHLALVALLTSPFGIVGAAIAHLAATSIWAAFLALILVRADVQ